MYSDIVLLAHIKLNVAEDWAMLMVTQSSAVLLMSGDTVLCSFSHDL